MDDEFPFRVMIRGFVVDFDGNSELESVKVRSGSQSVAAKLEARPDVADFFNRSRQTHSGFVAEITHSNSISQLENLSLIATLTDGTSL